MFKIKKRLLAREGLRKYEVLIVVDGGNNTECVAISNPDHFDTWPEADRSAVIQSLMRLVDMMMQQEGLTTESACDTFGQATHRADSMNH